jgi:hypothetical protein
MAAEDQAASLDRFFEHHLRTVAARLERQTEKALERQRAAWRDALHREAVLEGKDGEDFTNQRRWGN